MSGKGSPYSRRKDGRAERVSFAGIGYLQMSALHSKDSGNTKEISEKSRDTDKGANPVKKNK